MIKQGLKMSSSGYAILDSELDFIDKWVESLGILMPGIAVEDVRQGWGQMIAGAGLLGGALKVKERVFAWGLAGHANSEIRLHPACPLKRLRGFVGIEANKDTLAIRAGTEVVFTVRAGGKTLWTSNSLNLNSEAQEFDLNISGLRGIALSAESETPLELGHVNWGELVAEAESGELLKIGDGTVSPELGTPNALPMDFTYGEESMANFLVRCGIERRDEELDGDKITVFNSFDSKSGLALEFTIRRHKDFPVCEWHIAFENRGGNPSGILRDVKSLFAFIGGEAEVWKMKKMELFRTRGSFRLPSAPGMSQMDTYKDSFLPVLDSLDRMGDSIEFGAGAGCCSDPWMPFFSCKLPFGGGLVFAIGWSGQWKAKVSRFSLEAGFDGLNACLMPGERISLPSIHMVRYDGDEMLRGNNILRRFIRERIAPRYDGRPLVPPVSNLTWGGMSESLHLERIANIKARKLPLDAYWIDAGWFGPEGTISPDEFDKSWVRNAGNWSFNPTILPDELRKISKAAHEAGLKLLLWVDPERAMPGTQTPDEHPEWFLGNKQKQESLLLNLGDKAACDWCIELISGFIEKQGLDIYREDFNFTDTIRFWRGNDAGDRQGITEIKAIAGLYRFWSELRRRFPKLIIDNCAGGGRRIEIELLRQSVPLWASDMQCIPGFNPDFAQTHVSGLSHWLPFFAFGTQNENGGDTYNFRSSMAAGMSVHYFSYERLPVSETYPHEWLRERLEEFHACKDCFSGDYYPLAEITHDAKAWSISQYYRPDLGKGILLAFRRGESSYLSAGIRLRGLNPDSRYEILDFDGKQKQVGNGGFLMEKGIRIDMNTPRSSRLLLYKIL